MLKISWTKKVKSRKNREEINNIYRRNHKRIGQVLQHDGLLHTIIEGRMEGTRRRERKRQQMIDDITERRRMTT